MLFMSIYGKIPNDLSANGFQCYLKGITHVAEEIVFMKGIGISESRNLLIELIPII